MPHSALGIRRLRLTVRLGAVAEERATPQPVEVSITVRFASPPAGCDTDALADTVDYARLAEAVKTAAGGEHNLIEHLGAVLYKAARGVAGEGRQVGVFVRKLQPPLADLAGGSTFWYGDWQP